jgi:hypothetical protein
MINSNSTVQVSVVSAALFTAFSVGTALAPNLASFFVFRILTAFQGTAFLVIGSAVIGDIYKPVSSPSLSKYQSCCVDYCGPLQNTPQMVATHIAALGRTHVLGGSRQKLTPLDRTSNRTRLVSERNAYRTRPR